MSNSLGKLKRTLSERCKECEHVLEVRVRQVKTVYEGMDILVDEDYICCSNCDYERTIKKSKERFDVKAFSNRDKDKARERGENGRGSYKSKRTY